MTWSVTIAGTSKKLRSIEISKRINSNDIATIWVERAQYNPFDEIIVSWNTTEVFRGIIMRNEIREFSKLESIGKFYWNLAKRIFYYLLKDGQEKKLYYFTYTDKPVSDYVERAAGICGYSAGPAPDTILEVTADYCNCYELLYELAKQTDTNLYYDAVNNAVVLAVRGADKTATVTHETEVFTDDYSTIKTVVWVKRTLDKGRIVEEQRDDALIAKYGEIEAVIDADAPVYAGLPSKPSDKIILAPIRVKITDALNLEPGDKITIKHRGLDVSAIAKVTEIKFFTSHAELHCDFIEWTIEEKSKKSTSPPSPQPPEDLPVLLARPPHRPSIKAMRFEAEVHLKEIGTVIEDLEASQGKCVKIKKTDKSGTVIEIG